MLETIAPSAKGTVPSEQARQWWSADKDEAWRGMVARAKAIAAEQETRRECLRFFASLYTGRVLSSLYDFDPGRSPAQGDSYVGWRVTWNICQAAVETLCARITNSRTRVRIAPYGADWKARKGAEMQTKWLDGLFHEQKYYEQVAGPSFTDAAVFDGGIPYVAAESNGIILERILPFELLVDRSEGMYGRLPLTSYRCSILPRDAVLEAWGKDDEKRAAIEGAARARVGDHRGDVIEVLEGWRAKVGSKNGRRIVAIGEMGLADDEWKLPRMPYSRVLYTPSPIGFWGQGAVERLVGTQLEINRELAKIQEAHRRMVGSRWMAPVGSNVTAEELVNRQGGVTYYAGANPPTPVSVPGLPPEAYQRLEGLWARGFEMLHLSQMSVSGSEPPGMASASGAAREAQRDTEQEGFQPIARRFSEMTVDVAELVMQTGRLAFAGKKDAMVRAPGTRTVEKINWRDLDLREDSPIIRAMPSGLLPTTPAARREAIQEMRDRGDISPEAAAAMMGDVAPDVEGASSPLAAQFNEAHRAISRLLDNDDPNDYEAPDEQLRPEVALELGAASYLMAKGDGAPPPALGKVLRWMDDARERLKEQAAAAMPPAPMPGEMPPMGMAPPAPGLPPDAGLPPGMGAPPIV